MYNRIYLVLIYAILFLVCVACAHSTPQNTDHYYKVDCDHPWNRESLGCSPELQAYLVK